MDVQASLVVDMVKLAASILAADWSRLGEQVHASLQAGVEYIHVDVMDGHFVPNLTAGPAVVAALRPIAREYGAVLDVHLMTENPERYFPDFIRSGADILTVHVETCPQLPRTLRDIQKLGASPGVTLNPNTPIEAIREGVDHADLVLVMSVMPGFGGQSYIPDSTTRIRQIRRMMDDIGSTAELQVDGGIGPDNADEVVGAGASVLVSGSAIFGGPLPIEDNLRVLRSATNYASNPSGDRSSGKAD